MMTANSSLFFPPEIWRMTLEEFRQLGSLEDLIWLWSECRHVSKLFLGTIEDILRTEHLPKTRLGIEIGKLTLR